MNARKVLLSSYSRKKTRRRKRGRSGAITSPLPTAVFSKLGENSNKSPCSKLKANHSKSSSPTSKSHRSQSPSIKHSTELFPLLTPKNKHSNQSAKLEHSHHISKTGEVNIRESSLDDSGVVDDHDDCELTTQEINMQYVINDMKHLPISTQHVEAIEVNCDNIGKLKNIQHQKIYAPNTTDYLSHIVIIDDLPDRNCPFCKDCCMDYNGWLQLQQGLDRIVRDPLFELTITVCIILNTIFLAMEHHGMSESVLKALDIGNKVFTSIFTFECCLKLMALSKEFFECGWNVFDLLIVSASLLDLIFELVDGLSVLRGLRLLRVLKLAQSWITMKVLLSIIISTIGALGNLTFVLLIVIYIFAVIGMQLFSKDYTADKFFPDPVPRWNFTDFFHSFMMIFRILCGEWIEPLWDCMRAEHLEGPGICLAIFLPTLVMGNFMVLNLFLALLLNSFNSEELRTRKEEVGDDSKLAQSFERIRDILRKRKLKTYQFKDKSNPKFDEVVQEVMQIQAEEKSLITKGTTIDIQSTKLAFPRNKRSYQEAMNRPISIISYDPSYCQDIVINDEFLNSVSYVRSVKGHSMEMCSRENSSNKSLHPQYLNSMKMAGVPIVSDRNAIIFRRCSFWNLICTDAYIT